MSLIKVLDGTPLYTTKKEALAWALANGLTGFHTHKHNNKKAFMGGSVHPKSTDKIKQKNIRIPEQSPIRQSSTNTKTTSRKRTTIKTNTSNSGY